MKNIYFALLCTMVIFSCTPDLRNDEEAVSDLIVRYCESVNSCDTVLVNSIWAGSNDVSFIAPGGHFQGRDEIRDKLIKGFADRFSDRDLRSEKEIINIYGNVAWVEFSWVYDYTTVEGVTGQTRGLETQILRKIDGTWKYVHVHYSAANQ